MRPSRVSKISRISLKVLLIGLGVSYGLFVLVGLSLSLCAPNMLLKGQMVQALGNMKQLQLASSVMEADGIAEKDPNLGWPGDTGSSFSHWMSNLVPSYLSAKDAEKLFSLPGRPARFDRLPTANDSAILVYAVSSNSPPSTVFLSTANFTNTPSGGLPLNKRAKPFGDKGFVIMSKEGSGLILKPDSIGNTNHIGGFAPLCR